MLKAPGNNGPSPPQRWLAASDLADACWIQHLGGYRPHPRQWVGAVPAEAAKLAQTASRMVLIAIDGISLEVTARHMEHGTVTPVTSTFPSTSAVAWLSAATGLRPHEHGVPGVAWRSDADDELIVAYAADAPLGQKGLRSTLFSDLKSRGIGCRALLGDLRSWPGPWRESLLVDAELTEDEEDWDTLRWDPGLQVEWLADSIDHCQDDGAGTPHVDWIFLNLDDYIHRNGYDNQVRRALRKLDRLMAGLASKGVAILSYSDHGMTSTVHSPRVEAVFAQVSSPELSKTAMGGAGRVRWAYPREECRSTVWALLQSLSSDCHVATFENLVEAGLIVDCAFSRRAIGSIICWPKHDQFIVEDSTVRFEHGGISAAEMFVGLTVWR